MGDICARLEPITRAKRCLWNVAEKRTAERAIWSALVGQLREDQPVKEGRNANFHFTPRHRVLEISIGVGVPAWAAKDAQANNVIHVLIW